MYFHEFHESQLFDSINSHILLKITNTVSTWIYNLQKLV